MRKGSFMFNEMTKILREAVIDPTLSMPLDKFKEVYGDLKGGGLPELNKFFNDYDIYFVDRQEFIKLAHPKDLQYVPPGGFAYTHPENGLIAFVNLKPSPDKFIHILRHELVHRQQVKRQIDKSGKAYAPDIKDASTYHNNKQEMMAWALSTYDGLSKNKSNSEILEILKNPKSDPSISSQLYNLNASNKNRFLNYLYSYVISKMQREGN